MNRLATPSLSRLKWEAIGVRGDLVFVAPHQFESHPWIWMLAVLEKFKYAFEITIISIATNADWACPTGLKGLQF